LLTVSSVGHIQRETPDSWDSFRRRRTHGSWAWRVRRGRCRWPSRRWRRRETHTAWGCSPTDSRGVSTEVAWTASESSRRTNCRAERVTRTCTAAVRRVIDWFWRLHKSRVKQHTTGTHVHQRRQFPFGNNTLWNNHSKYKQPTGENLNRHPSALETRVVCLCAL